MKFTQQLTKNSFKFNEKLNVLCETYRIREQIDKETGRIDAVFLEGVAITFGKPTRNRVSYTYKSGVGAHKTLIKKPFLDTHNDSSIRTHPPFGHVEDCFPGTNPKNGLPCLNYKVNIDPEETMFIRKAKRGDIPGVSIQVLVDDVTELDDMYGTYIEANIREFLELSAVLIPGDGDTSISFAERFNIKKKKFIEDLTTSNGEGVIGPDGVFPKRKILAKGHEEVSNNEKDDPDAEQPLMELPKEQKHYDPKYDKDLDDIDVDKDKRFFGSRNTEVASRGLNCPIDGKQLLCDKFSSGYMHLRCWECQNIIPLNNRKFERFVTEAKSRMKY